MTEEYGDNTRQAQLNRQISVWRKELARIKDDMQVQYLRIYADKTSELSQLELDLAINGLDIELGRAVDILKKGLPNVEEKRSQTNTRKSTT